ncbi:cupin domain-containing protein [Pseudemcibacter aquimaris]|uniref:cupin domain-containing protein n=1 Tax=Pseudemcibacter aquimaris TaxID=2857064 RepID=UPI002011B658|nr:cupin domain-containing protein [Pseudemcibacter aquimaris]MCC3861100.1 cupin domain-containing protein [Pseudemcibacter aquimaris]WDU59918.1 DUF861 domain-containing protein [Pseudemcibacter aquimaris]
MFNIFTHLTKLNFFIRSICALAFLLSSSMISYAQENDIVQLRIPNSVLAGETLGDFAPYNSEISDLMVRENVFYKSSDGGYSAGIWESKTGSVEIDNFPITEIIYILEGSAMLNAPGKVPIAYSAGEGIVIPKGWSGTFTVPQGGLKMIYSNYTNDDLGIADNTEIVLLDRDTLAGKRFAEFRPFDPDVSDIIARDHEFYRTTDDKYGVDVWEAQPGQVPFADLGYDEMIYVLEGNMTFVNRDGNAQIYGEGKVVVLPSGWSGTGVVSTNGARVLIFWYRHASGE